MLRSDPPADKTDIRNGLLHPLTKQVVDSLTKDQDAIRGRILGAVVDNLQGKRRGSAVMVAKDAGNQISEGAADELVWIPLTKFAQLESMSKDDALSWARDDSSTFEARKMGKGWQVQVRSDLLATSDKPKPSKSALAAHAVVNEKTGGVKESKLARMDLVPVNPLWWLSVLYGKGAQKYAERNWERGYAWGLSYAAAMRHLVLFWNGEDMDPEMGVPHPVCAVFHLFALTQFMEAHPELDDRPNPGQLSLFGAGE